MLIPSLVFWCVLTSPSQFHLGLGELSRLLGLLLLGNSQSGI